MSATITCSNCKDEHSAEWSKVLPDHGTYTYCPACKYLDWVFPPELSPYNQEGFACEFTTGAVFEQPKFENLLEDVQTRVESVGFKFDFELSDWLDVSAADMAAEFRSLEGQLSGVGQLEMTSWQFDPNEDEEGNEREISRLSPEFLEQIVEDALEDMFDSRGGDGYSSYRQLLEDALTGLTYDGNPLEITVMPGEWTGQG